MTIAQHKQAIDSIYALVREAIHLSNWRSNESGLVWITVPPNGIERKAIPLRFTIPGLTARVSYFVDGEEIFYVGGERGSHNYLGRVVSLNDQSDTVLHAIAKALVDRIAPPSSS